MSVEVEGVDRSGAIGFQQLFRNTKLILLAFLCLIGFNVIFILSLPVFLFRFILIYIAKLFRHDLAFCMDAVSSILVNELFYGKRPRCTTILPITLSGNLTRDELERTVQRTWIEAIDEEYGGLKYPQFQQYPIQWLGFPFLKIDNKFSLKRHIFSYSSTRDSCNGEIVTEDELNKFVEKLLNDPYPSDRSPWELHVVENYRNDKFPSETGELSVVVMRIHHSLADGFSLLDAIVGGLMEFNLKDLKIPEIRLPKRTLWEKLIYCVTLPFTGAYEISFILSHVFRDCPWKVPDSLKSWNHKYANSPLIPISKVKHVKNTFGVSFSSVLMSAISAGISKNLAIKKRKQTLRVDKEEDYMTCLTSLPWPDKEKSRRLKNNVGAAVYEIPICEFSSPVDRLKRCHEILVGCVNSVVPLLSTLYMNTFGCQIGKLGYQIGRNRIVSTGMTNFPTRPDTDKDGYIAGKKVLFAEFASGTLVGDAGVAFLIISYHPYIRVTVTAESALLPRDEINTLVKHVVEELDLLYSIANEIRPLKA